MPGSFLSCLPLSFSSPCFILNCTAPLQLSCSVSVCFNFVFTFFPVGFSNHHYSFENHHCPGCGMFVRQNPSVLSFLVSALSLVCRSLSSPNAIRFRFNQTSTFINRNCVKSAILNRHNIALLDPVQSSQLEKSIISITPFWLLYSL